MNKEDMVKIITLSEGIINSESHKANSVRIALGELTRLENDNTRIKNIIESPVGEHDQILVYSTCGCHGRTRRDDDFQLPKTFYIDIMTYLYLENLSLIDKIVKE